MLARILAYLAGVVSIFMAIFKYGEYKTKTKLTKQQLDAKNTAIIAAKEAEKDANEEIAKHKPNIRTRKYFAGLRRNK